MIWHLSFAEKENKDINILTETHINHDQIHHQTHIRNNWLDPIFFILLEIVPQKDHLSACHPGLEDMTVINIDPKWDFVSFKATPLPLITKFSVLMTLQGIASANSWLKGRFFKGLQNYMEYKIDRNDI